MQAFFEILQLVKLVQIQISSKWVELKIPLTQPHTLDSLVELSSWLTPQVVQSGRANPRTQTSQAGLMTQTGSITYWGQAKPMTQTSRTESTNLMAQPTRMGCQVGQACLDRRAGPTCLSFPTRPSCLGYWVGLAQLGSQVGPTIWVVKSVSKFIINSKHN